MILYHYCSTSTFENIVKNKSIWLSSLLASNDTQEGRWLSQVFMNLCAKRGVAPHIIAQLKTYLDWLEGGMDCLGFCLSENGDMLSQWRGYADDATGLSIGFKRNVFDAITAQGQGQGWPSRLCQVAYTPEDQEAILGPRLQKVLQLVNSDFVMPTLLTFDRNRFTTFEEAQRASQAAAQLVGSEITSWFDMLYRTKNPAFSEEREWRFIREHNRGYDGLEFRARGSQLVPYVNTPFSDALWPEAIEHVFVGPRNPTPLAVIQAFLKKSGCNCTVEVSKASYR